MIESITSNTQIQDFRQAVNELVNDVRLGFTKQDDVDIILVRTVPPRNPLISVPQTLPVVRLKAALAAFVESKKLTSVRPLTIKQLEQRIRNFIGSTSKESVAEITNAEALVHRDLLLTQGRSIKTNKEYLAACLQFFKWCRLMNYATVNPFENIKIEQKIVQRPNEERERWQDKELKFLLSSSAYQEKGEQFRWITMLMLYGGLRPSEACQLRVADIQKQEGVDCIRVTNEGELQRVKTPNNFKDMETIAFEI